MSEYDPYPDAIDVLGLMSPAQRHAIARLLEVDGTALAVLQWIAERPDCDRATAAMIFWRLRCLPSRVSGANVAAREPVLSLIAAMARRGAYGPATLEWDGLEAWDRTVLINAPRVEGTRASDIAIPADLIGPFWAAAVEPATHAFFEYAYDVDDIFDSLWRISPVHAAATDWLTGKSAEAWMTAVDEMQGSHPDDIQEWMIRQPECPSSVAGQIFWLQQPQVFAEERLEWRAHLSETRLIEHILLRWREGSFAPSDLDFSRYSGAPAYRALLNRFPGQRDPLNVPPDLLDPPRGRAFPPLQLYDDFDFFCFSVSLGGLVPRGRDAAVAAWHASKAQAAIDLEREQARKASEAAPPSLLERVFYGGKFTGAKAQVDRAWRQFNAVMAAGAIILIVLMRGGAPVSVSFAAFVALVIVLSVYQASAKMGGAVRITGWWTGAFVVSVALAFLFRWIDKGVV